MEATPLGTKGTYQNGTAYAFPAVVTNANDDGTVDIVASDGGQLHSVEVKQREVVAAADVCFVPN